MKMKQYRYMKKREKAVFRTKKALEKKSPLTIDEIYEHVINDEYGIKKKPLSKAQIVQFIRGEFVTTKIRINNGGYVNLYELRRDKNEK